MVQRGSTVGKTFTIFLLVISLASPLKECFGDAYEDVVSKCLKLKNKWKQMQCQFQDPGSYELNKTDLILLATGISSLITKVNQVPSFLQCLVQGNVDHAWRYFGRSSSELEKIITAVRDFKEDVGLRDCQTACLVSCASSVILKYDHSSESLFGWKNRGKNASALVSCRKWQMQ